MPKRGETLLGLAEALGGSLENVDIEGARRIEIGDVTHDSRRAGPGVLFAAIPGFVTDGHVYIPQAQHAGAPAVLAERPTASSIPHLLVDDTRMALGPAAALVHGHPSRDLAVVGITGTNGKTSVTRLVESVVTFAGEQVGVIGTLGVRIGGEERPGERTTPEADDLQRLLTEMRSRNVSVVAAEVSSHALRLGRVAGVGFRVVAFTNLTQDHLDFHDGMEDYFDAKASLFQSSIADEAVIWVDDAWGRRLAGTADLPVTTVGGPEADIAVSDVDAGMWGNSFTLAGAGLDMRVDIALPGRFMVANAALTAVIGFRLGLEPAAIAGGLSAASAVPGRFEPVPNHLGLGVVVDYSHTPAGIAAAIAAARSICSGAVIAVFGAGGDRDRGKRPLMGEAATAADRIIVTSDNPRSEAPAAIMADVMEGISTDAEQIIDRRAAIRRALDIADAGDLVLIMGKGHERYQEIAGQRLPFDDRVVVLEELAGR